MKSVERVSTERYEKRMRTACKRWLGQICRRDRFSAIILGKPNFSWIWELSRQRQGEKARDWNCKQLVEGMNLKELLDLHNQIEEYRYESLYGR